MKLRMGGWGRLTALLGGCVALGGLTPADAHKRDFAYTYEWYTPAKGEKEIEAWNTYVTGEKAYQGQVEFETGITERFALSLYGLLEKEQGSSSVKGYKVESRYRFGDFAEGKILPAAYLEYEKVEGETSELEAKAIFSRFVGASNLSLNLIGSRHTEHGAEKEYSYALGYATATRNPALRMGVEAIGSLQDNSHAVGPTFAYDINPSTRAILGTAFGISGQNATSIRLLVEYEWF